VTAPSGEQHEINGHGYRAVVTESGGTLRALEYAGRPLLDGFAEDEMPFGGRGQQLVPWPNRLEDGRYSFDGRDLQLPLSEPARHNASHGLLRWVPWRVVDRQVDRVSLETRLVAQTGYPWVLDCGVHYALDAGGLTVTQRATNRSAAPAPYACGRHPYLVAGAAPVDGWEVTLPAATRVLADPDRKLPTGTEAVAGTAYDFRAGRQLGDLALDDAFTDLDRDPDGRVVVRVRGEWTVELWADEAHDWLQVYSADDAGATARRSLAVEPMTAPANAFRSGQGLRRLEPGRTVESRWGLRTGPG
jgi:aldose 1-epimerase